MSRTGALSFDIIENSKNSAVKWIKMERDKLSLLEDQSKEVKFKVSIPSNATPGEYYAVIMVEPEIFTDVKDKKNPVMLQMKTRVAVVIVLDVPGRMYEKKGEVNGVKVIETDSLVKITSAFNNTGDIHLDVTSEATIRSIDGKINYGKFKLKALSSSKDDAFVFPGAIRDFEGVIDRQLPKGEYIAEVSYNYGYEFKKARLNQKFSIKRTSSLKEDEIEFLSLESKELKLSIPAGAMRTQALKITNVDYRPINVVVESNDWIKINPKSFSLKPGEVRNIQVVISVSEYKDPIKKANIVLRTDRGKSTKILVEISKPGTPASKEKVVKKVKEKPATEDVTIDSLLSKKEEVEKKSTEQPQAVNENDTLKDVKVSKEIVKPEEKPAELVEDTKSISELLTSKQVFFISLGLVGLVIVILLIILRKKRKTGKSAKN
jgi:hypothetical protein